MPQIFNALILPLISLSKLGENVVLRSWMMPYAFARMLPIIADGYRNNTDKVPF